MVSTDSPKFGLIHAGRVVPACCVIAYFCSGQLPYVQMISGDTSECTKSSHCWTKLFFVGDNLLFTAASLIPGHHYWSVIRNTKIYGRTILYFSPEICYFCPQAIHGLDAAFVICVGWTPLSGSLERDVSHNGNKLTSERNVLADQRPDLLLV